MSAIDTAASYGASAYQRSTGRRQTPESFKTTQTTLPIPDDSINITKESREYYKVKGVERTPEEQKAFSKTVATLLRKLNDAKKDLNGHVDAIMKKNGIRLSPTDNLRLETDASGRIYVGGVADPDAVYALEEALNKEDGMARKVRDYQSDMRKASSLLRSETGKSLPQLVREMNGDIDNMRRDMDAKLFGESGSDDYYSNLEYIQLFSDSPELAEMVKEIGTDSLIALGEEARPVAESESTLLKGLRDTQQQIKAAFDRYNEELMEKLQGDPILEDPDFESKYLLNLARVDIKVSNDGEITIDGDVADEYVTDARGKEIIRSAMQAMLEGTDESGQIRIFKEATDRIMMDYNREFGKDAADDARVMLEIGKSNPLGSARLSSPAKEAEIMEGVGGQVNALMEDMGVTLEEPLDIAINKDGTLSVTNLPSDELKQKQVLAAMKSINTSLMGADEDDQEYGKLKRLVRHYGVFQKDGLSNIRQVPATPDKGSEVTEYVAQSKAGGGVYSQYNPEFSVINKNRKYA